jgi:hypothetical protein
MIAKNEFMSKTWKGNALGDVHEQEMEQNYIKPLTMGAFQACE